VHGEGAEPSLALETLAVKGWAAVGSGEPGETLGGSCKWRAGRPRPAETPGRQLQVEWRAGRPRPAVKPPDGPDARSSISDLYASYCDFSSLCRSHSINICSFGLS
jgi:hypothetical protein